MDNKTISEILKLTARLMELHGENEFKSRSYSNASFKLSRLDVPLAGMNPDDLEKVDGIGKSLAGKISLLIETNRFEILEELLAKTPKGVVEMMAIKGIGPKKVRELWIQLQIESVGELLYACTENRLIGLKGFGLKTQDSIKKSIEYKRSVSGKFHFASVENLALEKVKELKKLYQTELVSLTGEMRRKCEIIEKVEILVASQSENSYPPDERLSSQEPVEETDFPEDGKKKPAVPVQIFFCQPQEYYKQLFISTASEKHLSSINLEGIMNPGSEEEIYSKNGLPFIIPEMREGIFEFEWVKKNSGGDILEMKDLKGILHNHSTWSDGTHTLKEMAGYCKELGYEYLGICDHSKSAFYANGLSIERVVQQQMEIDALNKAMAPFKIFKGIESDILNDGSLDYPEEILKSFDFIVASVHSNLKMNEEKATARVLKAIENPYTTILGHPTGRLLLSREGYPLDHKKIIDACAANKVVIELNAHPYRLDIDWRWIQYCLSKDVMISLNPDAHAREGYHDMYFGVCVARKGGLTRKMTFNAKGLNEMEEYFCE